MEMLQSIILGTVQGAAEFLPISSSGHLIVLPAIFHWKDQGLAFDVALHMGTLIALIAYFWKDWAKIFSESCLFDKFQYTKKPMRNLQLLKDDLLFIIIISTVPGILAGLVLNDYAETIFRNPLLVGATLSIGAIFLFFSDRTGAKTVGFSQITLRSGFLIGLAQALAIIPGISRSGITITAALFLGLNRTAAARFSFLLSTPIIFGAAIKELPVLLREGTDLNMIMGIAFAATSGYLAIKYMLKFLANNNYNIFVVYRLLLALAIFIMLYNF